jgi:hypothetical protein
MKRRLKLWVKVTLWVILMVGAICLLNNFNKKEVSHCIEAGNSVEFCEKGLR